MKSIYSLIVPLLFIAAGCTSGGQESSEEPKEEAAAPEEASWLTLFDGSSTAGWRGFNSDSLPGNWVIEDGTLKSLGTGGDIGGDIVFGDKEFDNFELELEWKISEGGNSGIFYHVVEGEKYKAPYETAPEYQLLDNEGYPDPLEPWQMVGADYAMYPADSTKDFVKPPMEWNKSRIYYTEDWAEYWLNGEKVVEFDPYSDDWMERRNSGKWDDFPDYAISKSGLIGLQDHGAEIWFRNIRIREL